MKRNIRSIIITIVAVFMSLSGITLFFNSTSRARDFEAEIAAKNAEIAAYQAEAAKLAAQADTLSNALAIIVNEKNKIQAQVDASQAKKEKLDSDIAQTKQDIINTRAILGDTIADIYVDDQISPIEMLFSSQNISDFLNKQEYRNSIRNRLAKKIDEIKELQAQLEKQQREVVATLKDQEALRDELARKQKEQQDLVDQTKGQEANYQRLSEEARADKMRIEEEQRAAIRAMSSGYGLVNVTGDPNRGGYPDYLYYAPQDSLVDPWGMYNRECVSYGAWKVYQNYTYFGGTYNMPYWGGIGHACEWMRNADNWGIPRGSTPRAKSIGVIGGAVCGNQIRSGFWYGHVAWVEDVNSDGTINISHFNWVVGQYSELHHISPNFFDSYIYF